MTRPGVDNMSGRFRPLAQAVERLKRLPLFSLVLPLWFLAVDYDMPTWHPWTVGVDARTYQGAANAWLAGGDPWSVEVLGAPFGAAPWTLLAYAPTSVLPLEMAVSVWMVAGFVAAVWVLHRLQMPLWWLAFPPLVQGLMHGNAQPIVLAALLVEARGGVALAGILKVYGLVPALLGGRFRQLAIAGLVMALTALVLPWDMYFAHGAASSSVVQHAWDGSATHWPPLVPLVLLALWRLRRHGWEWLAIPAPWPATQPYYAIFALPALRRRPWLAAAFAVPIPLVAPLAVMAFAVWTELSTRRGRRWTQLSENDAEPGGACHCRASPFACSWSRSAPIAGHVACGRCATSTLPGSTRPSALP